MKKELKRTTLACVAIIFAAISGTCFISIANAADEFYSEEKVFGLRPKPNAPKDLGHIGPTGILARVEKGVKVTVTGTRDASPAAGKFKKGEVILGVNGKSLKGLNPYVVLGSAITEAEAGDGTMVFDLDSKAGKRKVTIKIPVLGSYGDNWPVDCKKSKKIIENAAKFYHKSVSESKDMGIPTALPCLFLLSTGDDAHLPVVKKHFQKFIDDPKSIGDHTWNNGYNGIACAEYYLRTGDKDVLPVLQAICDDARDRQNFNSAWKHWGPDINPAYVAGGLMNPASTQVLTTLLLCKEIEGVNVDDKTLLNALKYFWRFVGHGTVPYGDHRSEGGVASNGKDAMIAVAMQVASGASGDTSIYKSARDSLSMSTLNGYPDMILGHADNGRGDGIWRGIASSFLMKKEPKYYREVMDRITWWYDLSRFDDGAMGLGTCTTFNDAGSGAGAAMTFTAPLKTLRITGAPRSKYAKEFKLPARLWGTEADLAFHNIKPAADYEKYGKLLPIYQIVPLIGSAYGKGTVETDSDSVSLEQLNQFVRHNSYMIRAQAAKGLRIKGELKVLENLLRDPDPRLRRAALDGIIDWRYWFGKGKNPLAAESFTPEMINLITAMLTDPKESTIVKEGALFAVGSMPVDVIQKNLKTILPFTKNEEWWLRDASFSALQGLERDPKLYVKVVPILTEMMVAENHTMPRQKMNNVLARTLKKYGPDSDIGRLLVQGFKKVVAETQVLNGPRGREGKYNIIDAIGKIEKKSPEIDAKLAELLAENGLSKLDDDELLDLVSGGRSCKGFLNLASRLKGPAKESLEKVLYESYLPEVSKRLKAGGGKDMKAIDTVLGLLQLRDKNAGWKPIGKPKFAERIWRFTTFEPTAKKDIKPKHEGRRYRKVTLPADMKDWFKPEFDASKWKSGKAPIGKGAHPRHPKPPFPYASAWGDGEILLARTTFELDSTDYDMYRLRTLCNNGFIVYLNGKKIRSYTWWKEPNAYAKWPMGPKEVALLKKGTNTLAVYAIAQYPSAQKPHWKQKVFGEADCYIEGLRKEDLY